MGEPAEAGGSGLRGGSRRAGPGAGPTGVVRREPSAAAARVPAWSHSVSGVGQRPSGRRGPGAGAAGRGPRRGAPCAASSRRASRGRRTISSPSCGPPASPGSRHRRSRGVVSCVEGGGASPRRRRRRRYRRAAGSRGGPAAVPGPRPGGEPASTAARRTEGRPGGEGPFAVAGWVVARAGRVHAQR